MRNTFKNFKLDAVRMDVVGAITYVGKALPGSATDAAVWSVLKIDETSGLVITWADGNTEADNIWDDHASLTYA